MLGITQPNFRYYGANVSKMTAKGQVTTPKRLRDHLGLGLGSDVEFDLTRDGWVFLKPPHGPRESKFAPLRGSAGPSMSTGELMSLTRGEHDD